MQRAILVSQIDPRECPVVTKVYHGRLKSLLSSRLAYRYGCKLDQPLQLTYQDRLEKGCRLLYVVDSSSKLRFLVDTGSEVSAIPRSAEKRCLQATGIFLLAANNTKIPTSGRKFFNLDLGLHREFPFVFLIADFRKSIIGVDILATSASETAL
nr:gag pol polyprotein [Hymenolepis microstoma]